MPTILGKSSSPNYSRFLLHCFFSSRRPGEIVTNICKVYINFNSCSAFIEAVSRDGRSYSPELFLQAEGVLLKIGSNHERIGSLQELASKVKASAASQEADESLYADAPEHYLDAIMSVLMKDPVKLPSSGQIVDRQTIARHLLSDQGRIHQIVYNSDRIPGDILARKIL
jgi:hypothetical protein